MLLLGAMFTSAAQLAVILVVSFADGKTTSALFGAIVDLAAVVLSLRFADGNLSSAIFPPFLNNADGNLRLVSFGAKDGPVAKFNLAVDSSQIIVWRHICYLV